MKWIFFTTILSLSIALTGQEGVEVKLYNQQIPVATVTVAKGNTLFSYAQKYGTTVAEIQRINNKQTTALSLGENLLVPITVPATDLSTNTNAVPVFIKVTKGLSLYQIGRIFDVSSTYLQQLNNKSNTQLQLGERIIVGWYSDRSVEQDIELVMKEKILLPPNIGVLASQVQPFIISQSSIAEAQLEKAEIISTIPLKKVMEKGIAYWDRSKKGGNELLVMHRKAPVNTEILLYNPMLKRKVAAKVVSDLPADTYPNDISVVISPSVANALGVLDKRFLVEMTYVE